MMKKTSILAGIVFAACVCVSCASSEIKANYQTVPLPQEVNISQAKPFRLDKHTLVLYPEGNRQMERNARFLSEYIFQATGIKLKTKALTPGTEAGKNCIMLELDEDITQPEGYSLNVSASRVSLCGQTPAGVFHGIQTLRKSLPISNCSHILLPAGSINDAPRFSYRGMHLDVSRHFFSLNFIKKYIDMLALQNMNTFHWHLTDDQGWRIEIKKYPRLTEIGSTRQRTVIGRYDSGEYDETSYGGFYTQEEAREIVEYARERYIEVIPEVDLPGHMLAALAAYPELGCTGGPYEVSPDWGVFDDVLCIGNEKTFDFLEGVLTEIIDIFPSRYIHIGGDETPRTRWESCPKCQARIRNEGLKSDKEHTAEDRLQSYCMARIEKFLNTHNRNIIGWDEILDGDVAPNATIMSWRGMEGGIRAAQMGHDVIMTPTTHAYLNFYQTEDRTNEPIANEGYVSVEKAYNLDPIGKLTEEQAKHILGVQGNLWTEYIPTTEHAEYMLHPRMAALSEVQWTQPDKKSYSDFVKRLLPLLEIYQLNGYNYSTHLFNIEAECTSDRAGKRVLVTLKNILNAPIHYTIDGTVPTSTSPKYEGEPIEISHSTDIHAIALYPDGIKGRAVKKHIEISKSAFCPITLTGTQPDSQYTYNGAAMLTDGITGFATFHNGTWLGFIEGDVTAVIDLKTPVSISKVSADALIALDSWIMGCAGMEVAISDDNRSFQSIVSKDFTYEPNKQGIVTYELTFPPIKARYVQVILKQPSALPKGHPGAGEKPYLFLGEIKVD